MKKLFSIIVGLFISLNLANANDLLFKASNGTLNQNSVGVKKLNDEEMAQVKGGYFFDSRDFARVYYNNYGQIIFSIDWFIELENSEKRNSRLYINSNDSANQAYQNYKSLTTYARAGSVAIQAMYNASTGETTAHFVTISPTTRYYSADKFAKNMIDVAVQQGVLRRTKQVEQEFFAKLR